VKCSGSCIVRLGRRRLVWLFLVVEYFRGPLTVLCSSGPAESEELEIIGWCTRGKDSDGLTILFTRYRSESWLKGNRWVSRLRPA
jgi:hypothetical protein